MLRTVLRSALAVSGSCAVLLGGAWAGGAFSRAEAKAAPRPPRATDEQAYPQTADGEIPVGDALVVNGQPMELSLFVTDDPVLKVVDYYRDAFLKRHLIPFAQTDGVFGHISVFDPEDGYQRFITAYPQGGGQTLVMVGVTNPRKAPRFTRAGKSMAFPIPDEQRGFLGYESRDGKVKSQNGQFASALPAPALFQWYRERLEKDGYRLNQGESSASVAIYNRGDATITIAAQMLGDKTGSMVFVNRIEGGEQ